MDISFESLDLNGTYSYADYLKWKFEERVELFKGKIFKMSPAPSVAHQKSFTQIFGRFFNYFNNKQCQLFGAPFDIRLIDSKSQIADKQVFTVVQPDLCVICDEAKLDAKGCVGAPDLIVEILSPGNTKNEMSKKFKLYEEAGVREYWIVEPVSQYVLIYHLVDNQYVGLKPFSDNQEIKSVIFPDLSFNVEELFN